MVNETIVLQKALNAIKTAGALHLFSKKLNYFGFHFKVQLWGMDFLAPCYF